MYFTSYEFIIFMAVLVLLYYTAAKRFQWQLLLAGSFVFYAFSGWQNLVYIYATAVSTYFVSTKITALFRHQDEYLKKEGDAVSRDDARALKAAFKAKRRRWLILCLVFNFGILAVVKYADFMVSNINSAIRAIGAGESLGFFGFLLPMGISFYTFQTMGYIIDVYRGKEAERNFFRLALFTTFFPQLIQGPISRYEDLKTTLYKKHSFDGALLSLGIRRMLWGFFKKLVIADRLLIPVREMIRATGEYQGVYVLISVFLYAVALYADFTGGIDVTIGAAQVLGIRLKENFNMPFYSKNIAEYWRRWHITMGTWFKDYLFYPISVSKPMLDLLKRSKKLFGEKFGKRIPIYISTIFLWFMTGLWHGATWNFIVWGLANGAVIIISQELTPLYARFHKRFNLKGKRIYNGFEIFRTFWLMCFIRAFDIYDGVGTTFKMFSSIITNTSSFVTKGFAPLGLDLSDYAVAALGTVAMIAAGAVNRRVSAGKLNKPAVTYTVCLSLALGILLFGVYGIGYDQAQFIYNQF